MIEIVRYSDEYRGLWNDFVAKSKNGTFILLRGYMEYHSDRFVDYSLIALCNSKVIALLPANIDGDTLISHGGLTYGGWITPAKGVSAADMLEIWAKMNEHLKSIGVKSLIYKVIPHIYHKHPAEEDLYALFRNRAEVHSTLLSSAIDLRDPLPFDQNARRGLKFAVAAGIEVRESLEFEAFWDILSALLYEKYGTKPVHSLEEIKYLHSQFPQNIKLIAAYKSGEMLGGTLIYMTDTVEHVQYIATTELGRELKILPAVFDHAIRNVHGGCRYFDFGTSNEDGGKFLNEGLIRQKYGFGARGIVYTTCKCNIRDF